MLLALKTGAPCVRFQQTSHVAKHLADVLQERIGLEHRRTAGGSGIFGGGQGGCLVLVVDRRSDPVTPLLSQWTYQAMVHELVGIRLNRLDARQVRAFRGTGLGEVTLNAMDDEFLRANRRKNYGDACIAIKDLMESCVPCSLAYLARLCADWWRSCCVCFCAPCERQSPVSLPA